MDLGKYISSFDIFITFFLTILITSLVIKFSSRIGMLDVPNKRSAHVSPTPRGAGVAMFLSYMIILFFTHIDFVILHWGFFLGLSFVFLVGVIDDNKEVSPRLKFIFIIIATSLLFFVEGLKVETLGSWGSFQVELPFVISLFITLVGIIGFTNALNLIDGLDGLAGAIALVILASLWYVGYRYDDAFILTISMFVMVSLIGFLIFNWSPASIFMGDSGSLVLGFIIATLSVRAMDYICDTSILFIAALPLIDTFVVMTRRIQRGLSPFLADKTHLHHKLLFVRGSVDGAVHIIIAMQILLSALGLLLRDGNDLINIGLFIIVLFIAFQLLDERKMQRDSFMFTRYKKIMLSLFKRKGVGIDTAIILSSLALVILLASYFL